MGVIWLCGVRPAGYTRTLIFYVLTIHFFTPAEQLRPGYEIRIITDDCLIIPAVALMLFSLVALIKAPQFKGLLIQAAHSVLRGIQVQEGRCLRTTSGIRVLMKNQKIQCHFFIPPAPHCFLLMQCRKSSVGSQSLMTSTNAERG